MCGGKAAITFSLHALALRDEVKVESAAHGASVRFLITTNNYSGPAQASNPGRHSARRNCQRRSNLADRRVDRLFGLISRG